MPTKIEYKHWDGCNGGWSELIGYCKEEPFDVLKKVILTHDVYDYMGLYRPIDYDFPNNVAGLCIKEAHNTKSPKGCKFEITGSFDDLDLSIALTRNKRNRQTILDSLEECREWHDHDEDYLIDKIERYVKENIR